MKAVLESLTAFSESMAYSLNGVVQTINSLNNAVSNIKFSVINNIFGKKNRLSS